MLTLAHGCHLLQLPEVPSGLHLCLVAVAAVVAEVVALEATQLLPHRCVLVQVILV